MSHHYQRLGDIFPPLQEGEKVFVLADGEEIPLTICRYSQGLVAVSAPRGRQGLFKQIVSGSSIARYRRQDPSTGIKMEDFL